MRGDRLKKLRKSKKMTQEELGEIVNVTKVSVSGYENNKRSPDVETLQKLANFFEVSTDYLLGRDIIDPNNSSMADSPTDSDEINFRKWAKDSSTGVFFSEILESEEAEIEELREIWEIMKRRKNKS